MQPLVSILMPCYNAEKYLHYAIQSVLRQDYQNLEIIFINDGSNDSTLNILNEYKLKDKRIVVVDNGKNIGLIDSLNNSLKFVNGHYFARMDADDYATQDRISMQVDYLMKHNDIDLIGSAYNYFEEDYIKKEYVVPVATTNSALKFLSLFATPVAHPTILVKSDLIRQGKYFYDKEFIHAEDFELFSRLLWQGFKISNLSKSLHWLRLNPTSVSARFNDIQVLTNLKIVRRNLANFSISSSEIDDEILRILSNRINTVVSWKKLDYAFDLLDKYYLEANHKLVFSQKENQEVNTFLINYKLNILIQANKIRFKRLGCKNAFFLFVSIFKLNLTQYFFLLSKLKKFIN